MYKNIIWDFDGTLFNTYPGVAHTFLKVMKEKYQKECEYEEVLKWSKYSLKHCADNLSEGIEADQETIVDQFHAEYMENGAPIEETHFAGEKELVELIKDRGGLNLLVTHRGGKTLRELLAQYGMKEYFTELISRDEDFPRKPDPAAFLYLIEKYDLNKENTLAVGDRKIDVDAAHNADLTACYFSAEGERYEESDYNIDSLLSLKEIIE